MKSLTKLMAMGLLSVGLAACTNDDAEIAQNGQELPSTDNVYMTLNLQFPQSRTQTDGVGSEVGTDSENFVKDVKIILTNLKGDVVESKTVYGNGQLYTAVFTSPQMQQLANQNVDVYVACNAGNESFGSDATNRVYSVINKAPSNQYVQSSAWADHSFLMTNANVAANKKMPTVIEMETIYNTKTNPIDLGTVPVERAAARLDYAPAVNENLYKMEETLSDGSKKQFVDVKLKAIGVLNVSNSEYYFRRVNNGIFGEEATIGGLENMSNYVVDTDWDTKNASTITEENFYYPLGQHVISKNNAAYGDLNDKDATNVYKTFSYTSENTIPKVTKASEINKGDLTTVVFKGVLTAGKDATTEMTNLLNGTTVLADGSHPAVVCYQNKIYGTWEMAKAYAEDDANDAQSLKNAIAAVEGKLVDGKIDYDFAVNTLGFKFFTWNKAGYEVYYYYENEHNEKTSGASDVDPMRYGVVRNNVYKLKVNKITEYGHPFDNSLDPDPIDPTDPVTETDAYFEIGVKVLPWTVRINDIEF